MPRLTDRLLAGLTLPEGKKDRLVFDDACPGLGVRVSRTGRSFIVQWVDRATGRNMREPLGRWGAITIEQARTAARARLAAIAEGRDLRAERAERRAQAEAEKAERALTLASLIDTWADLHLKSRRPGYAGEAVRALRYAFAERLDDPARTLPRAEVLARLDGLLRAGKEAMAGRTLAYGRACYAWAEKRGMVAENPFAGLPVPAGNAARDRVLDDGELAALWAAADREGWPFGPFAKVLLLTLQRRDEVAGMRWAEISPDGTTWTLPGTRMKKGKAHVVHLAEPVRAILAGLPRFEGSAFVFTTTGRTPISGLSRAKARLDALSGVTGWRYHDFRRSGVSWLAGAGFNPLVADLLLAHKPSTLRGAAAVYQRAEMLPERARALDAWAAHLLALAAGNAEPANVVALRA